jgi:uncharacterized membrane protein HdeD (DUF308 family)
VRIVRLGSSSTLLGFVRFADARRKHGHVASACVIPRNRSRFSPIREEDRGGTVGAVNSKEVLKMDTTLDQFRHTVETQVTKARWALGINGALAVAVGVLILVWPNISLEALVIVFGAFSLARGIIGLGTAIGSPIREGRGWLVLSSLASIAVGVVVFFWTDMSALALLYVIGAYAITLGIFAVWGAIAAPLDREDSIVLALSGVVSILFGIVMFAEPGAGALVLLSLIAAYMLVIGVAELTLAIGGKRLLDSQRKHVLAPPSSPTPTH